MAIQELKLPDLGEGVHEGEILKWLVKAGDDVQEDQSLVEVMTDKVTAEIPSPFEGKVIDLLAPEGAVVPVGTPLVSIETSLLEEEEGNGLRIGNGELKTEVLASSASSAVERRPKEGRPRSQSGPSHIRAVPFVRKLARDLGVSLEEIVGTGPAGRITEADVRETAAHGGARGSRLAARGEEEVAPVSDSKIRERDEEISPAASREPRAASRERSERIPFRGLRRRIAERMVEAQRTAACVTYVDEVDLTELVTLREKAQDIAEAEGVKLTYLPFVLKAAAAALRQHPKLNAVIDEERGEIVLKKEYHLGVAVETEDGLLVPVIRDVDRKSILDLAREIADLAGRARAGLSGREELQGSTFTVTSMGALGGLFATPILNPPEVAILGVHKIRKRPVCRDDPTLGEGRPTLAEGRIVARDMAHLSLTFDHRALDGTDAARFVSTVIRYLEEPNLLLFS